jgi:hypothetical protein
MAWHCSGLYCALLFVTFNIVLVISRHEGKFRCHQPVVLIEFICVSLNIQMNMKVNHIFCSSSIIFFVSFVFFLSYSSNLSPTPILSLFSSSSSSTSYSSSSSSSLPFLLLFSFPFLSPPRPPPPINGYSELFFITFLPIFCLYSIHKCLTLWEVIKNILCQKYLISIYTELQLYIHLCHSLTDCDSD